MEKQTESTEEEENPPERRRACRTPPREAGRGFQQLGRHHAGRAEEPQQQAHTHFARSDGQRERAKAAEHDRGDHHRGQHAPHRRRCDAGIGVRVPDRLVSGRADRPGPPPSVSGVPNLGGTLPGDRLRPHRPGIRLYAAKIRTSAPAPSKAASRSGTPVLWCGKAALSSRTSPTYAASTASAKYAGRPTRDEIHMTAAASTSRATSQAPQPRSERITPETRPPKRSSSPALPKISSKCALRASRTEGTAAITYNSPSTTAFTRRLPASLPSELAITLTDTPRQAASVLGPRLRTTRESHR